MPPAQDVVSEHPQTFLNSLGPSGRGTEIVESRGSLSQLHVEVTVLRAHDIPHIKRQFSRKRRFFVTVTNLVTTKKTERVQIYGETVVWNQRLSAFSLQRSSHLIICLYEKRLIRRDVVIGTHEIPIPVASRSDIPFLLSNGDGNARRSTHPVVLYLTITVSATIPPPIVPNNIPTQEDDLPAEESTKPPLIPDPGGLIQPTTPEPLSPSSGHIPGEAGSPMPDGQAEMSPTEEALFTLRRADEAKKPIDRKNTWKGVVRGIKWVMDTLSPIAELHPFAKMAYGLVSAIPETLLEQYQRDDNVLKLLEAMHDAFDFAHHGDTLKSTKPNSKQGQILTLMLQDVCSCSDFIQSYTKDSEFWKRTLKNLGGGTTTEIEDLSAALVDHRRAFMDQAIITTEITALQILDGMGIISAKVDGISTHLEWVSNQVSDAEVDAKIREIPYGTGSRFSPDKGCLTGTRTAFLDFIVNWVNDPSSERGLVLFGQAGTGKSSIAHEIARRFDKMHRLTSSFIFLRKEQTKREAYHLFTTLARDLSDRYPSFKTALGRIVKDNSSLRVGSRDYCTLFQSLILEPLKDLHIVGPILVVIDGLDESGDVNGGNGLHTFLAKNLSRLPSNFRMLITSRPEDGIKSTFFGAPSVRIKYMDDLELAAKTDGDILTFIRTRLHSDELNTHCDALATKAEGLFQWAAVACGYILNPPDFFDFSRIKCVQHLLKHTVDHHRPDPLDGLYGEVLKRYFRHQGARRLFRSVMEQLITAFEPLSIQSLIALRWHASSGEDSDPELEIESVRGMLRRLGSLLSNVNSSDEDLPIIPLHTSFRDFLTNKEKSGDFYVDVPDSHRQLADSCLGLLLRELKFNICNLESSYLSNNNIWDLRTRISRHIPPALLYACRFWDDHFGRVAFETGLFGKLRTFFETKFLFWLEVLSLTSDVRLALPAISLLNAWLASGQGVPEMELEKLRAFIDDASAFVWHFGIAMARSAPHVYISTLSFAPTCSLISAHYSGSFPRMLRVERGRLSYWSSLEVVISNVGGGVYSIALSSDGQRIVSGAHDGTIRMWNATTGETEAGPFTGHTDSVTSVALSPDGQRIVSSSRDRTIRAWDSTMGTTKAGRFTVPTDLVTSVAFSRDGQRIVSGSDDRTIRVWNAITGVIEAGPFIGHTDSVRSVAFSPDGRRVVSGSDDQTIRVWNATSGEMEAGPFTGHASWVTSVAFSPDGRRIVSGSFDQTVRVWNATTGLTDAGPFTRHTNSVTSVAFSPDGQRIVSGSDDQTIRVWNATTGLTEAGPFTGHRGWVWSVAFSPDGRRVVSGSGDRTVRVWNCTMGQTEADSPTGLTSRFNTVAFSPDGQRIVSGSEDGTVCVRNATTGGTEADPFTGHAGSVTSVAFSPDGQHIVSGSEDRTIRVWDATTAGTETRSFTEHTDSVTSVAFSPDGQHIVSSSHDRTIRVWNAISGETESDPFTGHESCVTSVAFSPDGRRIVSGSEDQTVRVWNTTTGVTEAGPFTGHTGSVTSVVFSPDGQRIASGSVDRTIRVWNSTTGVTEAGPFTDHASWVRSVAWSPDGQRIVSGSRDRTVRVWNASTRGTDVGPFTGHTDSVTSVVFSADGRRIVSGSHDGTIRMWNVTTGETTADPFFGHVKPVKSVTFSPDGNAETTRHVDFTDHSVINEEGWICGDEGELLMWIPPSHRGSLHRPSNIWVAGECETRVDLSTFVHGRSWTTCIDT